MNFNLFRLLADFSHAAAVLVLIRQILRSHSSTGISLKSQVLLAIVFVTRYLDLIWTFVYPSILYLTLFKIFFIASTLYTVYLIAYRFSSTYDNEYDKMKLPYFLVGSFILALIFPLSFNFFEILWTFSIALEAVALFPQIYMSTLSKEVDNLTAQYVCLLGSYRFFYVINWIYKWARYGEKVHFFALFCGLVQTALVTDFIYVTLSSSLKKKTISFQ